MKKKSRFLPATRKEMDALGWERPDVILVTGDSYIDAPAIGAAVVGRVLDRAGFKVAIIAQPDTESDRDITRLGEPALFWGVSGGSLDSMVANYTASGKKRKRCDYTPGGTTPVAPTGRSSPTPTSSVAISREAQPPSSWVASRRASGACPITMPGRNGSVAPFSLTPRQTTCCTAWGREAWWSWPRPWPRAPHPTPSTASAESQTNRWRGTLNSPPLPRSKRTKTPFPGCSWPSRPMRTPSRQRGSCRNTTPATSSRTLPSPPLSRRAGYRQRAGLHKGTSPPVPQPGRGTRHGDHPLLHRLPQGVLR